MLWDARIAADFGLRSFEVSGFGRATCLVSAMPALTSAFGAQNVSKSALVLGLVQPFGVATILSERAQVEFWRQREGIPALDVFKQASSGRRRRRRRIPHQALRAQDSQDVLESSRNSSPRKQTWWSRSGRKETCGGAGVVGKKRLVEQEWWERNAWWSRSGEAQPCRETWKPTGGCSFTGGSVGLTGNSALNFCKQSFWGEQFGKIEKRWKTGGVGTTRA